MFSFKESKNNHNDKNIISLKKSIDFKIIMSGT